MLCFIIEVRLKCTTVLFFCPFKNLMRVFHLLFLRVGVFTKKHTNTSISTNTTTFGINFGKNCFKSITRCRKKMKGKFILRILGINVSSHILCFLCFLCFQLLFGILWNDKNFQAKNKQQKRINFEILDVCF